MPGDGCCQLSVSSWEDYVREFLLLLAPIIRVSGAESRQALLLGDEHRRIHHWGLRLPLITCKPRHLRGRLRTGHLIYLRE